jgi:class 3 adenylate cyclase
MTDRQPAAAQTVLYAEGVDAGGMSERDRDRFAAEVQWLATRHRGTVELYLDGAAVVLFDEPAAGVRMAMDLQRSAAQLRLRMGVHTGTSTLAAQMAASASSGSIVVSPSTYALVREEIQTDTSGCLLMEEFHDSDLAQVCLTPAPVSGEHVLSTFAGLGR